MASHARTLWRDIPAGEEEQRDADDWLSQEHTAVIVAQREGQDGLVGFAEVGERPTQTDAIQAPWPSSKAGTSIPTSIITTSAPIWSSQ